jgi:GAF domain-containing protein
LQQKAAISEVLRVMCAPATDVRSVLEAVASRAAILCEATDARIFLIDGDQMRHAAGSGDLPVKTDVFPLNRSTASGRAALKGQPVQIHDVIAESVDQYGLAQQLASKGGWRTALAVPLTQGKQTLGVITLRRREVRPFTQKQIDLVKTFADQAAIAIENARLFNETKEALEHQKASANILRIVADSVENTDPVFEAITKAGMRLIPGVRVSLFLLKDGQVHYVSHSGVSQERRTEMAKWFPMPLERRSITGTSILEKRLIHVPDTAAVADNFELSAKTLQVTGARAMLSVPLMHSGEAIGGVAVTRETPGPFTEKQIALAQTFADQAVIAIRNAGMFREIQDRNAELKQSLDSQAASGEILASISSSMTDAKPVFDAIVRTASGLFGRRSRIRVLDC